MKLSPGLYAITDQMICVSTTQLLEKIGQAIKGGAVAIQYRNKELELNRSKKENQIIQIAALCSELSVPLIINDDPTLACHPQVTGVHLGKDDGSINAARDIIGNKKLIGVSCYNDLNAARHAVKQGADYIAFGSFFPSTTKPNAARANITILAQAKEQFPNTTVVAIGGITPQNASLLIDAGADLIAVINSVFEPVDSEAAARAFTRLFQRD